MNMYLWSSYGLHRHADDQIHDLFGIIDMNVSQAARVCEARRQAPLPNSR